MDCLVSQHKIQPPAATLGDASTVTIDIAGEIKSFIQANPIPSIGIAVAVGYLIYSLIKGK